MKVLFIHQNMPGQYKHLAPALAKDPNNQVVFLTTETGVTIPNVTKVEYKITREVQPETHKYLIGLERAIFYGQEVWRMCKKMKEAGFTPDIICAHPGWGEAMFVKDIYPEAKLLNFLEFYYRAFGADMHFDPEEEVSVDAIARVRVKNCNNLLALESCDWGLSPTFWQAKQNPVEFRKKITVLHDGVDTEAAKPDPKLEQITLPNKVVIKKSDEVITYVARNFEPYRGFPTVMRAFEKLQKERPNCQIIVVGNDGVSYGKKLSGNKTYKEQMLEEVTLDMSRIHFLGKVPHHEMVRIMQISTAHIYLTVPFVLSWSMLEAMSTGCALIASDTAPVTEVVEHGKNGLLVDFFSPDDVVEKICQVLDHPDRMQDMRKAARDTVLHKYALDKLLPLHIQLVKDLAAGQMPPNAAKEINKLYEKEAKELLVA